MNDLKYTLSLKDLFSKGMDKAINSTSKLDSKMSGLQSKMSGLASAVGIGFGVAGIVSFGNAVVESLKNYENFSASLKALMKGNGQASKALESQLVSLAATTPFSLLEIQDATKQLIAYGFSAGSVTKNISMLGDVASGLKIPFGDIAYLYGTLKTQGKAMTKDIQQFTARGIPVVKELAKQFKVADSEVMAMVTDGKVGFPEIEKAFQSMTKEGGMFFNMMSEQSKTVGGKISNLGDNWEQLKVNIGKSQTGIISGTVGFLNDITGWVSGNIAQLNRFEEAQIQFGGRTKSRFVSFMDSVSSFFSLGYAKGSDEKFRAQDEAVASLVGGAETKLDNMILKTKLLKEISMEYLKIGLGANVEEQKTRIATLRGALSTVQGKIDLAKMTPEKSVTSLAGGADAGGKAKDKGTEISGSAPKNIYINITKLVETLSISTTNLKESSERIREEVSKALLETVNDVNYVAR